eukprot:59543-Amphidinium_carterae.1
MVLQAAVVELVRACFAQAGFHQSSLPLGSLQVKNRAKAHSVGPMDCKVDCNAGFPPCTSTHIRQSNKTSAALTRLCFSVYTTKLGSTRATGSYVHRCHSPAIAGIAQTYARALEVHFVAAESIS